MEPKDPRLPLQKRFQKKLKTGVRPTHREQKRFALRFKDLTSVGTSKSKVISAIKEVKGSGHVTSDTGDQQFEALSKYGNDLTSQAARLDPVIGRDEEIRRSIRILCRRTKNNPCLIGEPGMDFCNLNFFNLII